MPKTKVEKYKFTYNTNKNGFVSFNRRDTGTQAGSLEVYARRDHPEGYGSPSTEAIRIIVPKGKIQDMINVLVNIRDKNEGY
jgi:hypothetical protein